MEDISVCFLCGHSFGNHYLVTAKTGVYKYESKVKCSKKIDSDFECGCHAGFKQVNLTLSFEDKDTD